MKIITTEHKYVLFILITLFTTHFSISQQAPQYTQYMYNTMSLNPAYAGSTESLQANLLYRSQWVGMDGAPETQNFGIHSPIFNDRAGIGLNIVNDKIGPSSELFVSGNFSYKVRFSEKVRLALGLKAGVEILNIDWFKGTYYDNSDVLLNNNINDRVLTALGAGAYLYTDKWYLGFSVPNFIRTDYYDEVKESVLGTRLHYFIIGGYVFNLSNNLKFKPTVLAKIVPGSPVSADASANFLISEIFTLGVSYRWEDSVSALAGFQIFESLFVGYTYDYSTSDFNQYNNGSHEIMLRYEIPANDSRIKSPRFF